jgi:hypothetical protein
MKTKKKVDPFPIKVVAQVSGKKICVGEVKSMGGAYNLMRGKKWHKELPDGTDLKDVTGLSAVFKKGRGFESEKVEGKKPPQSRLNAKNLKNEGRKSVIKRPRRHEKFT